MQLRDYFNFRINSTMKYIFVLLFIQFFVLKSQNSIEQVANKYHNIDSMSFMVELFTKDRYSDKIFKNTYYYQINKRVNDKYDWTNYDISMLSNYPTYSSFNSIDFIIKLTQRRLDSLEYANFPIIFEIADPPKAYAPFADA